MSPGVMNPNPQENIPNVEFYKSFSLTPQVMLNYLFKNMSGISLKVAYPNFGISYSVNRYLTLPISNPELEWTVFHKLPATKKRSYKFCFGGAASINAADDYHTKYYIDGVITGTKDITRSNNYYLVGKTGIQWLMPGKHTSLFLGLDYHLD